ncbi:hypothetical protein EV421DRAFT_1896845 [Armillaria borealis]|uniref:Protein kinase domain-containing protein n=1 Tax=Armillaria borealis TaxID=47425 RepID=A0AA39N1R1_9AGAR|nr:hypothetical protein EV421DRAFT_1896845 [Armillaria borealis]
MRARAWIPQVEEGRIWKMHRRWVPKGGNIVHDLKPANDDSSDRFTIGESGMAKGIRPYLATEELQVAEVFCFGMTMLETASNIVVPEEWRYLASGISWFSLVAVMSERMTDGSGRRLQRIGIQGI